MANVTEMCKEADKELTLQLEMERQKNSKLQEELTRVQKANKDQQEIIEHQENHLKEQGKCMMEQEKLITEQEKRLAKQERDINDLIEYCKISGSKNIKANSVATILLTMSTIMFRI